MSGYISLERTGDEHFDAVLEAIERSGDMYHHTSQWLDEIDFRDDKKSCLDIINEKIASARKFAELLEAKFKPKWISVDDRLPTVSETAKDFQLASGESDRVLILMNGYEHIGTYHSNIDTWSIPFHSGSNWKPTHWMPLPKDTK